MTHNRELPGVAPFPLAWSLETRGSLGKRLQAHVVEEPLPPFVPKFRRLSCICSLFPSAFFLSMMLLLRDRVLRMRQWLEDPRSGVYVFSWPEELEEGEAP